MNLVLKNRRSLSSQNTRVGLKKKKTFRVYKNSRSRYEITPDNKTRLSTAKHARKLISPSEGKRNIEINDMDYKLPQLKKVKKSKYEKNRQLKTPIKCNRGLLNANTSSELDFTPFNSDFGDMKANQAMIKNQAKMYQFLAEGPVSGSY